MYLQNSSVCSDLLDAAIDRHPVTVCASTSLEKIVALISQESNLCALRQKSNPPDRQDVNEARASCVLVVENNQVVGSIGEGEIVECLLREIELDRLTAGEVMNRNLITIRQSNLSDLFAIVNLLKGYGVGYLPVLDDRDRLVGLVSSQSLQSCWHPVDLLKLRRVVEAIDTQGICVSANSSLQDIVQAIARHQHECAIVCELSSPGRSSRRPLGIVSKRDLVRARALNLDFIGIPAREVIGEAVVCVKPDDSLWVAHLEMQRQGVRRAICRDEKGELLGIVTQASLLRAIDPVDLYGVIQTLQQKVGQLSAENRQLSRASRSNSGSRTSRTRRRRSARSDRLLEQIALNTYQNRPLSEIFGAIASGVREVVGSDRAIVCRFLDDGTPQIESEATAPGVPSVGAVPSSAVKIADWLGAFAKGERQAIANLSSSGLPEEVVKPLQELGVKAQLVLPIARGELQPLPPLDRQGSASERPWGLLVVQYARRLRRWKSWEIEWGEQLAVQLAVAIRQHDLQQHLGEGARQQQQLERQIQRERSSKAVAERSLVVVIDARGRIVQVDPHTEASLGTSDEALRERRLADLFESEARAEAFHGWLVGDGDRPWESTWKDADGELMPIVWSKMPLATSEANGQYTIATATIARRAEETTLKQLNEELERRIEERTDQLMQLNEELLREIADRQKAQQALRESEWRYRAIVEDQTELVCRFLPDGTVTFVNDAYCRYFQQGRSQALGSNFLATLPQENRTEAGDRLQQLTPEHSSIVLEYPVVLPDGERRALQWSKRAIFDERGLVREFQAVGRDIQERQAAEQALRESEQRFRLMADNAPVMIWLADADGNGTFFNKTWLDFTGQTPAEADGKGWIECLHPEDRKRTLNGFFAALKGRESWRVEYRLFCARGEYRWILHTGVPRLTPNGEFAGAIVSCVDIDDRKHAEETLLRISKAVESSSDAIAMSDLNGQSTYHNSAFIELFEYNVEDLNAAGGAAVLFADVDCFREVFSTTVRGESWKGEVEMHSRTGRQRQISLRADAIKNPAGQIVGAIGIYTDITERKSAEQALRQSEERFRTLANFTYDWEYWIAPDGEFIYMSASCERICGYSVAEFLSDRQLLYSLIHPEDRDPVVTSLQDELVNPKIFAFDFRIVHRNGQVRWVAHICQPVYSSEGEWLGLRVSNRDITERKEAEEALREKQRFIEKITETTPNLLYIYDTLERRNTYANREFAEILGYTPQDIEQMGVEFFAQVMHPDDLSRLHQQLAKLDRVADGEIMEREYRIEDKNGQWHWFYSRDIIFTRTADGKPKQILGTASDITERKQTEQQLHQANSQLKCWVEQLELRNREMALLGEMSDFLQACLTVEEAYKALPSFLQPLFPDCSGGIFAINNSNNLVELVADWGAAQQGESLFVPHECWALRRGRSHVVDGKDVGLLCSHVRQVALDGRSLCVPMMATGMTWGMLHLSSTELEALSEAKQKLARTVCEHIALALANLKLRETLQYESIRDPLTGLFNRRYLEESLEREVHRASRAGQPLGILMLDVDHFKRFNDTFGHEAGDAVLRELGRFLKRNIRDSDIACRYGGEELTLIFPEASLENTIRRAEEIREGVKFLNVEHRRELLDPISLSVGVACFPEHGQTGEAIIRAADAALYRAKLEGRDRVVTAFTS
jgi:diguanylate cyclase (GGDEF)-like protein/PAS domain S-box-containing protein